MLEYSRDPTDRTKNMGVNSANFIQLEVRSRTVPNLVLVDLPGIVGGHVRGEPDDMPELTYNLAKKYLERPDTLVLIVESAETGAVSNSKAFGLVQSIPNKVDYCIGVLTKARGCTCGLRGLIRCLS